MALLLDEDLNKQRWPCSLVIGCIREISLRVFFCFVCFSRVAALRRFRLDLPVASGGRSLRSIDKVATLGVIPAERPRAQCPRSG